jgi:ribosomal protein S18 acetylase RimI-like enzyme
MFAAEPTMWRMAAASDDDDIVSMCMALNAEDPGPAPVSPQQVRCTLTKLREESHRGRALVCEVDNRAAGYALLISFWSNELGGEVCIIDELFVAPAYRGRGLATELLMILAENEQSLWPAQLAALALEVSPGNERARALYERLGFRGDDLAMRLHLPSK